MIFLIFNEPRLCRYFPLGNYLRFASGRFPIFRLGFGLQVAPLLGRSATPLMEKGQRRLSSSNRQSAIKNRQCVARLMCLSDYEAPIKKKMREG
jgi:hypothetical protein